MSKRVIMLLIALALVLGGLAALRPSQARAGSWNGPVLLIHGWNAGSAVNCNSDSTFGTIKWFFATQGYTTASLRSLGYYSGDYGHCDDYLWQEGYHCNNWFNNPSTDKTVNDNINHTSCELAWYIWDHYTQYGTTIAVIAHSMGGILIRQAMHDTPYVTDYPPYLKISDVVTAGTPHQGLFDQAAWFEQHNGCPGNCMEVYQMQRSNVLMSSFNSKTFRGGFGRNPQGYGGTDWTTMSSENDDMLLWGCTTGSEMLGAPWGVDLVGVCGLMPGATHFVVYPGPSPSYNHGGYLTDTDTTWNAHESYSDNNGGTWYTVPNSEHSIYTMFEAILVSSW